MRASIIKFCHFIQRPLKTTLQLSALVETIYPSLLWKPLPQQKWRDAFEREGFSSRIVAVTYVAVDEAHLCVKVVSLYPINSIMDQVNFRIILKKAHPRARGLGGMIKKKLGLPSRSV